jgi:hypothetical protein
VHKSIVVSQNMGPHTYCTRSAIGSGQSWLRFCRFDQQLMGKVYALSHLGDLHGGVRRRMITDIVAADRDAAQQVE